MTPAQSELFTRINAFAFDEADVAMPFAGRLAKDNGWSMLYARRVIEEYRRFAFLMVAAGHMAVPSDQVDQAWHQHLIYTRSWADFCTNSLRTPLHHEPTRGGQAEQDRFIALYQQTLQSYHNFFGHPPEDIWPKAEVRFGNDLYYSRVNTKQNFVIPRSWILAIASAAAILSAAAFLVWMD